MTAEQPVTIHDVMSRNKEHLKHAADLQQDV